MALAARSAPLPAGNALTIVIALDGYDWPKAPVASSRQASTSDFADTQHRRVFTVTAYQPGWSSVDKAPSVVTRRSSRG